MGRTVPIDRLWVARSSPGQTFVLFPLVVVTFEAIRRRGRLRVHPRFLPLLAWGYLQYRLCGNYREAHGDGGKGMGLPPERLVTSGPYTLSRNPMYLGHMIFTLGLALMFRSPLGAVLVFYRARRFSRRVRADEERLEQIFGDEYRAYRSRVSRWLPGLRFLRRVSLRAKQRFHLAGHDGVLAGLYAQHGSAMAGAAEDGILGHPILPDRDKPQRCEP